MSPMTQIITKKICVKGKKNIPECMPYVFVFSKVKHVFLLNTKKGKAKKKKHC
jgi:hypothetical protein